MNPGIGSFIVPKPRTFGRPRSAPASVAKACPRRGPNA